MDKPNLIKLTLTFALISEGIPIVAQLAYLAIYNMSNTVNIALDDSFMTSKGFYIFQFGGFFFSFIFFYLLLVRDKGRHLYIGLLFFLLSVAIEFSFYFLSPVTFRFVYLYSFLDKFIAILLALFTYLAYKDSFYRIISGIKPH